MTRGLRALNEPTYTGVNAWMISSLCSMDSLGTRSNVIIIIIRKGASPKRFDKNRHTEISKPEYPPQKSVNLIVYCPSTVYLRWITVQDATRTDALQRECINMSIVHQYRSIETVVFTKHDEGRPKIGAEDFLVIITVDPVIMRTFQSVLSSPPETIRSTHHHPLFTHNPPPESFYDTPPLD